MQKIIHVTMTIYGSNECVHDLMTHFITDENLFDSKYQTFNVIQLSCNTLRFDFVDCVPFYIFKNLSKRFRPVTIYLEYCFSENDKSGSILFCGGITKFLM